MKRRQKILRWTIVLFFFALLLITFLSGTIQTVTLPKVAVEKPVMGSLDLSVLEEGYLQPAYSAPLMAEGSWKVLEVHVQRGDRVAKGDALITFDPSSTEVQLEDAKTRYAQQQLKLEQLKEALKPLLREEDQEAVRQQERDMETQRLEMEIQKRDIQELEQQIAEGRVLRAPFDGIVTALTAEAGMTASPSQQMCSVASDATGYQLTIGVSGDPALALQIGTDVEVEIEGTEDRRISGNISAIENADSQVSDAGSGVYRTVTIDVSGDNLSPGLKATAYIRQESNQPGMKIPADAIDTDDTGAYVFTVSVKEGPLGSLYFAQKTYVETGAENDDTVVIADGLTHEDRVVTAASEPLNDGDRIRLE